MCSHITSVYNDMHIFMQCSKQSACEQQSGLDKAVPRQEIAFELFEIFIEKSKFGIWKIRLKIANPMFEKERL